MQESPDINYLFLDIFVVTHTGENLSDVRTDVMKR